MIKLMNLIATTAFGLESITAREIKNLGCEDIKVENGKVYFSGNEELMAKSNIWLRTADRVLIMAAKFEALSFEDLFQGVKAVPWEDILPEDAEIHVVGSSVSSKLYSVPDCQSITKKAIIERLKIKYNRQTFEETGAKYKISVSLLKDIATISIDTSGAGLHKRGYRRLAGDAPLKETLACALLMLSYWKDQRTLVDPLCGTGTIPIEACMIALNVAPGLKRNFVCESWPGMDCRIWSRAREEAYDMVKKDIIPDISGCDIDPKALELSVIHAREAGIEKYIRFTKADVSDFTSEKKYGFIVTNPPYGERLMDKKETERLYKNIRRVIDKLNTWSFYIITSYPDFEKTFGKKADKRRKLYNGRIECQYYQYLGPKPENI